MSELKERLRDLCERYGVASLYVFGSRAGEVAVRVAGGEPGGSSRLASDIDVAVQPTPGAMTSPGDRVGLTIALEDLFQAPRVDLVILPEAGPFLALDAIRGELLYCDDFRRAADLLPLQRERLEKILSGELRR